MHTHISAKLFFTVLWRGIRQILNTFGRLFGFCDGSRYALVVRRIFTGCCALVALIFTLLFVYSFATEVVRDEWLAPGIGSGHISEKEISNRIVFRYNYSSEHGQIVDRIDEKIMMRHVDWVVVSDDGDSLAVFSKNGKRGFINRFTGKVAIPLRYSRAWVFSEGLAAVEEDGILRFIDHSGRTVIDQNLTVRFSSPGYAFKNGYCIVQDPVSGKSGLIDRTGNWALEPKYDMIFNDEGYWKVVNEERYGLYTSRLELLFPAENTDISIYHNSIEVRHADHIARLYDLQGKLQNPFMVDQVESLMYETTEIVSDGRVVDEENFEEVIVQQIANRLCYTVESRNGSSPDYFGLLGRDGRFVTPPCYTSIQAIAPDRYFCQPGGVIINDLGNPVN